MASPAGGDPAASAAAGPAAAPEQYANPLQISPDQWATLPHDDAGPMLRIIVWIMTSISGVFLGLRLYCRFSRRRGLWWDDLILLAGWICLFVETALLTKMTTLGYGKHIWDFDVANNMAPMLVIVNAAGTLSVTAAIWTKTSFGLTLLQLAQGWVKHLTLFILISMNIAMGLSALFPWVSCRPIRKAWDMYVEGDCWAPEVTVYYNVFSGIYSACADLALALLPWQFIVTLQMRKKEKIGVGVAMSMGVFAAVTGFVKVSQIPKMLSDDFKDGVDLWLWGNAETSVTVIAASIPMLRVLIRDARGATTARRTYASAYGYYTTGGGGGNTSHYRTKTVSGGSITSGNENEKEEDVILAPKLTATGSKHANTRIVTITSGGTKKGVATAMTTSRRTAAGDSDVELGRDSGSRLCVDDNNDYHDDHSERGILGGADHHAHAEALKMGGIVQTSKFQIKYDKREDVPSREGV